MTDTSLPQTSSPTKAQPPVALPPVRSKKKATQKPDAPEVATIDAFASANASLESAESAVAELAAPAAEESASEVAASEVAKAAELKAEKQAEREVAELAAQVQAKREAKEAAEREAAELAAQEEATREAKEAAEQKAADLAAQELAKRKAEAAAERHAAEAAVEQAIFETPAEPVGESFVAESTPADTVESTPDDAPAETVDVNDAFSVLAAELEDSTEDLEPAEPAEPATSEVASAEPTAAQSVVAEEPVEQEFVEEVVVVETPAVTPQVVETVKVETAEVPTAAPTPAPTAEAATVAALAAEPKAATAEPQVGGCPQCSKPMNAHVSLCESCGYHKTLGTYVQLDGTNNDVAESEDPPKPVSRNGWLLPVLVAMFGLAACLAAAAFMKPDLVQSMTGIDVRSITAGVVGGPIAQVAAPEDELQNEASLVSNADDQDDAEGLAALAMETEVTKDRPADCKYVDCAIIGYTVSPENPKRVSSLVVATEIKGRLRSIGTVTEEIPEQLRLKLGELLPKYRTGLPVVKSADRAIWVKPGFNCRLWYPNVERGYVPSLNFDKMIVSK